MVNSHRLSREHDTLFCSNRDKQQACGAFMDQLLGVLLTDMAYTKYRAFALTSSATSPRNGLRFVRPLCAGTLPLTLKGSPLTPSFDN